MDRQILLLLSTREKLADSDRHISSRSEAGRVARRRDLANLSSLQLPIRDRLGGGEYEDPDRSFPGWEKDPSGTIFKSRMPLRADDPPPETEDWVTSRILWLDGMEEHNSNTRDRFIYIHGTKHEDKIGRPDSHGCIRMRNEDVIELFQLVDEGTPVLISE
jgi:hypothetical protein